MGGLLAVVSSVVIPAASGAGAAERAALEGTITVIYAEAPEAEPRPLVLLETAEAIVPLDLDPAVVPVGTGDVVRVWPDTSQLASDGSLLAGDDGAVAVADLQTLAVAPRPPAVGVRRVLVVPVYWSAAPPTDRVARNLGVTSDGVEAWYAEASRGLLRVEVTVAPWTRVSAPPSCGDGELRPLHDRAFAGYDTSGYDHIAMYQGEQPPGGCSWAGRGEVGGRRTWIATGYFGVRTVVHELGHNLGLGHAQALLCADQGRMVTFAWDAEQNHLAHCVSHAYGDPYSVMGGLHGAATGTFNAIEQHLLGWLRPGELVDASTGTQQLVPMASGAAGVRAIWIPVGSKGAFLVELRQPVGLDASWAAWATPGVQVRFLPATSASYVHTELVDGTPASKGIRSPSDGSRAYAEASDSSLPVGSVWTDPTGSTTLTVLAAGVDGAQLALHRLGGGGPDPDAALSLEPLQPVRLLDTRSGLGGWRDRLGGSSVLPLQVAGVLGVPADAEAVVANITVTASTGPGYVTAWPCGTSRPTASTLNYATGETVANLGNLALGAGGSLCLSSLVPAHVIVDISGAYTRDGGVRYNPVRPTRVVDTRVGLGATRPSGGSVVRFAPPVPAGAQASTFTLTAIHPDATAYVTAYRCDQPLPLASSVNVGVGDVRPNLVTVPIATNGEVCLFVPRAMDVVVDVTGYWAAEGLRFTPMVPKRVLDTRSGEGAEAVLGGDGLPLVRPAGHGLAAQDQLVLDATARGWAAPAAALNLTVTEATAPGYLTAWSCDADRPHASMANYVPGSNRASAAALGLSAAGRLCVYAMSGTHLVIDVNGLWRA